MLGPGFATQNPYAGFGALVLAVASASLDPLAGVILAACVGVAHGIGRVVALTREVKRVEGSDYLQTVLRTMRWKRVDGGALLLLGGLAIATYIAQF